MADVGGGVSAERGVPATGTLFANKALASTYLRILAEAEDAGGDRIAQIEQARKTWSRGFVAEAIDRFCRTQEVMDASGRRHRGVLAADDMARWTPGIEAPLSYDYGRYTVCKTGPWGQGPVMLQQLALLKGFEIGDLDPTGADFIHLQVECAKLAFADREAFYGDPDFVEVPTATLLSDAYNSERRGLVGDSASLATASWIDRGLWLTDQAAAPGRAGCGRGRRSGRADRRQARRHARRHRAFRHRRSSRQHDLGHAFGRLAAIVAGHSRTRLLPRHARANVLARRRSSLSACASKRPRTTLTPTLALRDGEPYLACGTPGGDQQDQWITQLFLRHVHAGFNLQEAIDAPAWHSEHFPSSFWPRTARPGVLVVEGRIPRETIAGLKRRGHIVEVGPDWSEGRLTAAVRDGKRRRAAANPRGMQGYAAGR